MKHRKTKKDRRTVDPSVLYFELQLSRRGAYAWQTQA